MDEVSAGVTDLLLGAVLLGCALRLRSAPEVHRFWALTFWTAGAGAFAGTPRAADLSWVVVGVLVAIAISYLLAASATELLEPRTARIFILLRVGGLVAYVVVITTLGVGRTLPLVLSESVTMASIVALWCYGFTIGHPRAGRLLLAIGVSALSAIAMASPSSGLLEPRSLQHIAQIPGVLLLCWALVSPVPTRVVGRSASHHVGK